MNSLRPSCLSVGKTPWGTKAFFRRSRALSQEFGIPLSWGMRAIARAYIQTISRWQGDWSEALQLFRQRYAAATAI